MSVRLRERAAGTERELVSGRRLGAAPVPNELPRLDSNQQPSG